MDAKLFEDCNKKVITNCSRVILGKEKIIENIFISFICCGHVLLEDVPGTGKTMLLKSFSKTLGTKFKRIQFTPDLMPSDLTGIHFYNQKTNEFVFREGPLFSNIVLADEINRATPRTQSALLEAMEEKQITVDGETFLEEEPFMVMATQNPLENYGTFPLPEAQMDRFFMKLHMGYMQPEQEMEVIARSSGADVLKQLEPVVSMDEIQQLKNTFHDIRVSQDVKEYMMHIITATRNSAALSSGVSTRGAIALYQASQVKAAVNGREFVIPEDVQEMCVPGLAHRLSNSGSTKQVEKSIRDILAGIPVPVEDME